ncbi:MAG: TfoX/Sxy family protein [Sulfitobacter sp.]
MSLSAADIAFATDLFSDIPDLSTRKMFGGLGFYSDGVIFALMKSDAELLLKAQDPGYAARLANIGARQWSYTRKNGAVACMPYWRLPDAALDDPEIAVALARAALALLR